MKEEKAWFDAKKLGRITGIGMAAIAVLILIAGLFQRVLPAGFPYFMFGFIVVDCLVIIIAANTICKRGV